MWVGLILNSMKNISELEMAFFSHLPSLIPGFTAKCISFPLFDR